jgi:hypothetical protein
VHGRILDKKYIIKQKIESLVNLPADKTPLDFLIITSVDRRPRITFLQSLLKMTDNFSDGDISNFSLQYKMNVVGIMLLPPLC